MTAQRFASRCGAGLAIVVGTTIGVSSPVALGAWSEDFDTYNTTQRLPDQSTWEPWNNDNNFANFYATTVQSLSGPNSVEIDGADDAVHRHHGFTIGKWEYTAWMFVPANMVETQYFILLNTYPPGPLQDWSLQIALDCGAGVVRDHNNAAASLPMLKGSWSDLRVIVDLDRDVQSVYYSGVHLLTKSWSAGVAPGGQLRLAATDLWGNNTSGPVYWDALSLVPAMMGQPSFSVDFQGPMMAVPDGTFGVPITEAEILLPPPPHYPSMGPLPPPSTVVWGGTPSPGQDLGLAAWPAAVGHPPGVPGTVEIDALSYGSDFSWDPTVPWFGYWALSVDEFAWGGPIIAPPNVRSEGMIGSAEASADVFFDVAIGPGPFPPGPPFPAFDFFDGNGLAPFGGPGVGLIEPNPPQFLLPDIGDNLDALDVDEPVAIQFAPFPVYFSMDAPWQDPLEPPVANSGSAAFHGYVGGDVLIAPTAGSPPLLFAAAQQLGLDIVPGTPPDSDDLDALILLENGDRNYQPSQQPFDWHTGTTDMLLFSVRRGSAVIGMPDSLWGAPIEEGDLLGPPLVGGVSPFPMIFIPAEMIGLGTIRSGTVGPTGFADDLDAADAFGDCNMNLLPDTLDVAAGLSADCNANYVPDPCDITIGTSLDVNTNGVPDECECPEDLDGSGVVDFADILRILTAWGNTGGPEDLDSSGVVDFGDILVVLAAWGPCPFT